jgi:pimeloyl-ACP methyl ester carboxylesterase
MIKTFAYFMLCAIGAWTGAAIGHANETTDCAPRDCAYWPAPTKSEPEPELMPFAGGCCVGADGALMVLPRHLKRIAFDQDGLATIYVPEHGVAYVRRDGNTAWMHRFDNGADYFVEGLARTVLGAKIGFVDKNLATVITPAWDFAFPFEDGLAIVCQGCRSEPIGAHGEHSEVVGGRWGYIDRSGAVVVPVTYEREQLPRPETVDSADGVPIAYTKTGHGDTALLLIHGGYADSRFWRHQFAAFAGDYQVVTVDMAGHGRSGRKRQQWTLAAFGEDVRAVVEALDLHRVVVIGSSMGGSIGLEAARIMPDRVIAVIGIDTLKNATAKVDTEARDAFVRSIKSDFAPACQGMMKLLFHEDADSTLVEEVRQMMCEPQTPVPAAFLDAFDGYDEAAAFRAAKVPIRSINGDLHPTNIEGNQTLADYDAVIMQNAGHYPMLERPAELNRLLATMLKSLVDTPKGDTE